MRLIDADAVLAALAIFHRHDNDNAMHFMNGIETAIEIVEDAPDVKTVPLKPLANWLAGYAFPPELKAQEIVNNRGRDIHEIAAEGWEDFLRGMDWRADDADD